jgi:predicted nicotinamide N-methyase
VSTGEHARIAGYPAALTRITCADEVVALFTVPDLERLVDRGALLRGEQEPPYWAHLWPGARALASYLVRAVDLDGRRVLDIGCGLGLCGLVAARRGAEVLCVDSAAPALAFVAASAWAGDLRCETRCADFRALASDLTVDVILAAEVAYDGAGFEALADLFVRHLAPDGVGFLADGFRTDTRALYRALAARPLATHGIDLAVVDEGRRTPLRLAAIMRSAAAGARAPARSRPPA